jgi:hypothetical protein
MSTALGHGSVGPNARGKPVSFAKRGGVPNFIEINIILFIFNSFW